jgi:hypothetical protein
MEEVGSTLAREKQSNNRLDTCRLYEMGRRRRIRIEYSWIDEVLSMPQTRLKHCRMVCSRLVKENNGNALSPIDVQN